MGSEPYKPKPIALDMPTYLKSEAGTASRRLNSLWLVMDGTCQTPRRRLPRVSGVSGQSSHGNIFLVRLLLFWVSFESGAL